MWLLSTTGLLPLRRRSKVLVIAPTIKPVTLPPRATVQAQVRKPRIRSAQVASPPLPNNVAKDPQKVSKLNSIAVSGRVMNGRAKRIDLIRTRRMEKITISTSIQVTNIPLLAMELSKLYRNLAISDGLAGVETVGSPWAPWP